MLQHQLPATPGLYHILVVGGNGVVTGGTVVRR